MKKLSMLVLSALLLFSLLPVAAAQEYGKIRALQERAAHVAKQKNDFVIRVLTSYHIPHEVNGQGTGSSLHMGDRWINVTAIEIVPMLRETGGKTRQVTAHEIYFFTAEGILDVVSELTIR